MLYEGLFGIYLDIYKSANFRIYLFTHTQLSVLILQHLEQEV